MKETLKTSIKFLMWDVIFRLFTYFPQDEKKIFYESFLGKSYSDNPRGLYEEISKNYDYKAVWSFQQKQSITGNAKQVKRLSLKYFYHLATSRYIIVNSRMPKEFKKAEDQILIQTWHGTPLKKLGFDIKNFTMPDANEKSYLNDFALDAQKWDFLLSQNPYSTSKFKSAFRFEGEIIELGYPRNDALVNSSTTKIKLLKEKYNINANDKVLLYAPTYRDNSYNDSSKYTQQIKIDLEMLNKRLPEWKIILRVHYLIANEIKGELNNTIIPKSNADINELMLISDCLMTDYSSLMFDYANLNKPMIFFAYDLQEYSNETRGFYQDYQKMICGENIKNTKDLVKILKNFTNYTQRYSEQRKLFSEVYCPYDDGKVSEKIVKNILGDLK